jgi:hypothetical protein
MAQTAGDAIELSIEERPEIVVLVTGDADFAHLKRPDGTRHDP